MTRHKRRKPEALQFVVKWIQGDTMYFRWFKRDATACAFLDKLLDDGFTEACIYAKH